jgi:hypothetical protein
MADDSVSRRRLLLSVGFVGSLAGCSTVLDGDGTGTADRTETTTATDPVASSPTVTPAGTRIDTPGRESTAPTTRERPDTTRQEPTETAPQEPTETAPQEPQPDIDVTETTISERTLLTGETLELVVTVTNVGDAEGTADLAVGLDGADGTEAGVDVPPGETVQRTFSREMTEAGTFAVSLNGETIGEVTVEPREPAFETDASVPDAVLVEEPIGVPVTVNNTGEGDGTLELRLGVDGEEVATRTVMMSAGETTTVELETTATEPGTRTLSLNGEAIGEVTVGPREPAFDVTGSLLTESISVEEPIEVAVEVSNTGTGDGDIELGLAVGGTDVGGETVAVPAGETNSVDVSSSPIGETGTLPVTLNGETLGEVTVEPPEVLHVATDGDARNTGTETAPLSSIDDAVDRAGPGQTVQVHSGEYVEYVEFTTAGDPDAPITLTGPRDAVLKPPETHESQVITVAASHVHITGLTITGLHDPDGSGDPGSYPTDPDSYHSGKLIDLNTFHDGGDDYIEGLVVSPHRIGNAGQAFINSRMIRDSEIGGFEVIGPAGANWILDDTRDHNGEMVYLGTAPDNRVDQGYEEYDRTRNVRVHHIDNSAGYPHSELVDCKGGVENITVEYCTDGGGARTDQGPYSRAVSLDGHDCTIRWNDIRDVEGDGLRVGPQSFIGDTERIEDPETDVERRMGKDHDIYGNVFTGCIHEGINFLRESLEPGRESNPLPEDQRALCDNVSDGYDDALDGGCPSGLPAGDGVGHLGGDSPWDGDAPTKEDVLSEHGRARELDTTVTAPDVPMNTEIVAEVTVTNNGTDTTEVTVRLQIDRRFELDTETVTLPPGETRDGTLRDSGVPDTVEVIVTRNVRETRDPQKIGGLQLTDGG